MIENTVREARKLARHTNIKGLAVAAEIEQRYIEYLDALLDSDLSMGESVIVKLDGKTIKFNNIEDVSKWITQK
jgi:hypothetical protein